MQAAQDSARPARKLGKQGLLKLAGAENIDLWRRRFQAACSTKGIKQYGSVSDEERSLKWWKLNQAMPIWHSAGEKEYLTLKP